VPMRIPEIVQKSIDKLRDESSHRFIVDIAPDIAPVEADPDRIVTVLRNLIDNAIKFSPPATRIEISARKQDSSVLVGVKDEGLGISGEEQEKLFKQFERLGDPARSKGLGLGLVVCKNIVEGHGGRIWVESEPGKGSTFKFTIPL